MRRCRQALRALPTVLPLLLLVSLAPRALALGREFIPLENWSYRAVERFEALGLCVVPEDRPLTRDEFIALTSAVAAAAADVRLSTRDRYNLERLEKEFTDAVSRDDPRHRYDPPTFMVQEAPLTLEGDVDITPSLEKAALGDDTEGYLRSDPEFKLHIGDRVTYDVRYRLVFGPEHGTRARDRKPSRREKSFKGLTSLFERSTIVAAWDKIHVFAGREAVDWGPSPWGNLITPGEAVTLDQVGLRVRLKALRLSAFMAELSPASRRYLAGHRLEVRWKHTVFGVSETVVYQGKQVDPIYLSPLSSFYANQFNERNNDDNILWSLDAKTTLFERATVYGSLLIDDFQFERKGDPDKLAFDAGGTYALVGAVPATIRARYRFVDVFTYTHLDSLTRYISGEAEFDNGDVMLGGAPGPDSDLWRVETEVYPRRNIVATAAVFGMRRGAGQDFRVHVPGEDPTPPFPLPVVERTLGFSLSVELELDGNRTLVGEFGHEKVDNIDHADGVDDSGNSFRLAIHWELL